MNTSESIDKLAPALLAAQREMPHAAKAKRNDHFKNRYADIETIIDTAKPILNKHGLFFTHGCEAANNPACLTIFCRVIHESGQWMESSVTMSPQKVDPQGAGSAYTYGRRYTLQGLLGMASEDDDGNAGSGHGPAQPQRTTAPKPATEDPKTRMAQVLKAWSGVKGEDLLAVAATVLARMGVQANVKDLNDDQRRAVIAFAEANMKTDWLQWSKENGK